MAKNTLVVYCLLIFTVIVSATGYFRYKFSGVDQLRNQVSRLEAIVLQKEMETALAQYELRDFQQSVATYLPAAIQEVPGREESYPLRRLASVVTSAHAEELPIERASSLFEEGRKNFRNRLFEEANRSFSKLIADHPSSVHFAESHFLLAEGHFQLNEFESCVSTIESMISLFPESELTGFALLRLGTIFEKQDRVEDAGEIYRTILKIYTDKPLLEQARTSLQAVSL